MILFMDLFMNGCLLTCRITLHKKDALPKHLEGLEFPLIENANEYIVHGLQWPDYLRELDNPQVRSLYSWHDT